MSAARVDGCIRFPLGATLLERDVLMEFVTFRLDHGRSYSRALLILSPSADTLSARERPKRFAAKRNGAPQFDGPVPSWAEKKLPPSPGAQTRRRPGNIHNETHVKKATGNKQRVASRRRLRSGKIERCLFSLDGPPPSGETSFRDGNDWPNLASGPSRRRKP